MYAWLTAESRASSWVTVAIEAIFPEPKCLVLLDGMSGDAAEQALGQLEALLRMATRVLVLTGPVAAPIREFPIIVIEMVNGSGSGHRATAVPELRGYRRRYWAHSMPTMGGRRGKLQGGRPPRLSVERVSAAARVSLR